MKSDAHFCAWRAQATFEPFIALHARANAAEIDKVQSPVPPAGAPGFCALHAAAYTLTTPFMRIAGAGSLRTDCCAAHARASAAEGGRVHSSLTPASGRPARLRRGAKFDHSQPPYSFHRVL